MTNITGSSNSCIMIIDETRWDITCRDGVLQTVFFIVDRRKDIFFFMFLRCRLMECRLWCTDLLQGVVTICMDIQRVGLSRV